MPRVKFHFFLCRIPSLSSCKGCGCIYRLTNHCRTLHSRTWHEVLFYVLHIHRIVHTLEYWVRIFAISQVFHCSSRWWNHWVLIEIWQSELASFRCFSNTWTDSTYGRLLSNFRLSSKLTIKITPPNVRILTRAQVCVWTWDISRASCCKSRRHLHMRMAIIIECCTPCAKKIALLIDKSKMSDSNLRCRLVIICYLIIEGFFFPKASRTIWSISTIQVRYELVIILLFVN